VQTLISDKRIEGKGNFQGQIEKTKRKENSWWGKVWWWGYI